MSFPRKIYVIRHNVTNRVYIGSSECVGRRYNQHIDLLEKGKHSSKLMQKDFDEYGADFSVSVIGEIQDDTEHYKEYQQMVVYRSFCPKYGYNQGDLKGHNTLTDRRHLKPYVYTDLNNYTDSKFSLKRDRDLRRLEKMEKRRQEALKKDALKRKALKSKSKKKKAL